MFERTSRLWVVHIGNNAKVARRAQREGFVCVGWTRIGDLGPHDTREKMKAAMQRAYPDWSIGSVNASYGQVFRFAHEMKPGEPVVYPIKGSREIMLGEIAGAYQWASHDAELMECDYANVRHVKWIMTVPRIAFSDSALHSFGSFSSVSSSDEHLEEVISVLTKESGKLPTGDFVKDSGGKAGRVARESDKAPDRLVTPETSVEAIGDSSASLAERAVEETKDYLLRQWVRTGTDFELVVAAVFRAMGYTATTQQGTHDLGVDVVAHPDPLGVQHPIIKVQCKSGTSTIGAPTVKQLRGLLNGPEKGVIVALGGFSTDARHVQQNDADLVLIDGDRFVDLFLDHYDKLAPEWRHRFPLTRVYVATAR